MPRAVWPPTIDSTPLVDAYQETYGNRLRRSQPAAGPAKTRRMAGKRPDTIQAVFIFDTREDLNAFLAWVDDVKTGLAGGAMAFDWLHPITQKLITSRFVPASEDDLFVFSRYKETSPWWSVQAVVEVLP